MTVSLFTRSTGGGGLTLGSVVSTDIALGGLPSSTAGSGRQCSMIDGPGTEFDLNIFIKIKLGTAPTSAKAAYIYLLTGLEDGSYYTDGAGTSAGGVTILNATPICAVRNKATGAATGDVIYKEVTVRGVAAKKFAIAVVHDTGVNLDATDGNHFIKYQIIS